MGKNKKIGKSEPLIFIRDCLPQLTAGEYTINSNIEMDGLDNASIIHTEKIFQVNGPRFGLQPSDIYGVYPPKGHTGFLENTLPHIVFKRRTLPWERTIDGNPHSESNKHVPWMALLLLNEDEIADGNVKVESTSLQQVLNPPKGVTGPQIEIIENKDDQLDGIPHLMPWEHKDDVAVNLECNTIDISSELFKTIVPSLSELPFLAHVRKVTIDDHKEQADNDDDGFFSVIIGNRLPTEKKDKEVRSTVFLVTIEGFKNYIHKPSSLVTDKVRMVVLSHWSFTVAAGKNFKELCEDLHTGPIKMTLNEENKVSGHLKNIYNYGFAFLPHTTRAGGKTLSCYRGPLNPNFLPTEPKTRTFESADDALRYDNKTGIIDVSYAAAWQLGRLLALKNREFATALHNWKNQFKQKVKMSRLHKELENLLPGLADISGNGVKDEESLEGKVKRFLNVNYQPLSESNKTPASFLISRENRNINWSQEGQHFPPVSKVITEWLGKLFLLYEVPFNYLVPHERMLEKESLRTFYIDSSWIESLLDGALSIARSTDSKLLINKVKDGQFLPEEIKRFKKEIENLGEELNPKEGHVALDIPERIESHITGFLLRSKLISGWKGIKVFAKGSSDNWLLPLRIERIESEILLCIFNGKVAEANIIQPPEHIHFGLENDHGSWKKKYRNSDGSIDEEKVHDISLRNAEKGVLDIDDIIKKLKLNDAAEYAFQMIESPIAYTLKIND